MSTDQVLTEQLAARAQHRSAVAREAQEHADEDREKDLGLEARLHSVRRELIALDKLYRANAGRLDRVRALLAGLDRDGLVAVSDVRKEIDR